MNTEYFLKSNYVFDGICRKPYAAVIHVKNGKIQKVISLEHFKEETVDEISIIDYGNQLIMPSFIDAHTHMFSGAVSVSDFVCDSLGKCRSEQECAEMIAEYSVLHPELKRLRGMGWFLGNWDKAVLPTKRSLDALIPDKPVYMQCADSHSMWLNSAALKEAGIQPNPAMENGIVQTDENGELTGMLIEPAAYAPAMDKYMEFSKMEKLDIYTHFQQILASYGIAAVSEMFADDYTKETYESYDIMKELDENEELASHVYAYTKMFGYTDFTPYFQMKEHYNSKHFHINGVKGFIDGVTETHTGLLLEPYTDCPGTCGKNLPLWPKEKIQKEIIAANRAGIQVRLHCIADGSVRMALDMYEQAQKELGRKDIRNTIEHIENIHPDDIIRFQKLQVIASMQPYHVTLSNGDKVAALGEERCQFEWPIRTIAEAGGQVAIGTDFPVVGLSPFETIYAALTRKDERGKVMCQNPWEVLDLFQILQAYTIGAARVYHTEERMGTLEAGKDANIIVLNQNIFELRPEEIRLTKVIATYFEGKLIFKSQ